MPDKVLYTAEATSTGDGRSGHVVSSDHRLDFDLARADRGGRPQLPSQRLDPAGLALR